MKISKQKTTWIAIGCAYTLLGGLPAIADDTELLLVSPDPNIKPKPNVMFIFDTSGSMKTTQTTSPTYDGSTVYAGACDPNRVYYTDTPVVPVCDGTNEHYIDNDNWFCEGASTQLNVVGSFSNTLIQYRNGGPDGTTSGPKMWQELAPGYNSEPVECLADYGSHGDGRDGLYWPKAGSDVVDWYTNDPAQAITFGSAPANVTYDVYDGNYLNYLAGTGSTASVTMSRSDIMKATAKQVLGSVSNMNVGLMRFNSQDGGPVILAMQDIDTNRQAFMDAIDGLPANGYTPLSETLYESALFWRGMPAYYGERINENPTDPAALVSTAPEVYKQPEWDVCAKNYNVLLTDGEPVRDTDTPSLAPGLPNFAAVLGRPSCTFANEGDCLDDIAEYLYREDVDLNTLGPQVVTTHTIGFTIDLPILRETALASGGQYFLADDVESLSKSLQEIVQLITNKSLSFSAPTVSVNTFNRTQNLNDLYITMFGVEGKAHWPGNLKKYRVQDGKIVDATGNDAVDPGTGFFFNTARSFWTQGTADGNDVRLGGAASQLPDPANRNLYTNISGNDLTSLVNHVSTANAGSFGDSDFGLTGATGEPTKDELIEWARGLDVRDEDNDGATDDFRNAMGDPLHSAPAAVVYGGTAVSPEIVVYTGTNDGYLHAIDGATGQELWSFIPRQLLDNLARLYFDPDANYKYYGIDGNIVPVVRDADQDGIIEPADGDFVYILFGYRRGDTSYMALDVTNKTNPKVLWEISRAEMGQSWSTPLVARVKVAGMTQNPLNAVVVLGGGYDPVHDTSAHPASPDGIGAGVYMFDLQSGALLWRAGRDSGADLQLSTMTRAIPNDVRVIDLNGDNLADRMYATDLGGQVLRFDIFNGQTPANLVTGGVIAQLGAEGLGSPSAAETRRFYNAPDVSIITDTRQNRRFLAVSVGTGHRAKPFDVSPADTFFSLRDGDAFAALPQAAYDSYDIITPADLVEVSGQTQAVITQSDRGWKFTLPPNEKVLAGSLTFNNEIFFVSFEPNSEAAVACGHKRGTNYLYRVNVINGDPIVPNIETLAPALSDAARRQTLAQGGIAPSPTFLFPSPDPDCTGEACSPPPIGCVGVECFDPGFENFPVRTLWTQDGVE